MNISACVVQVFLWARILHTIWRRHTNVEAFSELATDRFLFVAGSQHYWMKPYFTILCVAGRFFVLKQPINEEHAQRMEPVSITIGRKAQVYLLF